MSVFNRILVPIDGSQTALKALAHALRLARQNGASIRLVHVVDELSYRHGFEYSGDVAGAAAGAAQRLLDETVASQEHEGVPMDTQLVDKAGERLGDAIAACAAEFGADLVVAGTHGRRGLGRVLLGSGAEQIVRSAQVPVLVVPGHANS